MRCSTCGEQLAATDERCPICGTPAQPRARPHPLSPHATVRRCPRCQFTGQGVDYFSRPGHVALLVAASVMTYGVGGLVYWLLRNGKSVCPNCGFLWEGVPRLRGATSLPDGSSESMAIGPLSTPGAPLPSDGKKRRAFGAVLASIGALPIIGGIVMSVPPALLGGSVLVAGGGAMYSWGWSALRERRRALELALERQVLQLATLRGGELTVTDVATALDLSLPAAEKILYRMDDGFRVTSDVTDEGIVLFQFPEVQLRRLDEGDDEGGGNTAQG
jgi:hypothetical protein